MWGGGDVVCPPSEELEAMEVYEMLRLMPKLLGDEDARHVASEHLSSRLLSGSLDDGETRAVLRVLCAHSPSGSALLDLFLQLLQTIESPVPVIEFMSSAAASATPLQLQPILDRYRELSNLDRKLLVPIIGSIAEMQLSAEQKRSYEVIVKGALKYVDESDVPTVVQSLLSLACPANSASIVAALREQAAALAFSYAILLVEPVVAALRSTLHLAKAYWLDLSRPGSGAVSGTVTQLDVLVVGQILQVWSLRHDAANALLEAAESDPSALSTIERALQAADEDAGSISKIARAEAPHSTVSAYVRLAMQLALIPGSTTRSKAMFGRRRLEQRSTKLTAGLVSAMSRASFSHRGLRSHTITVLLSACAHKEEGVSSGSGGVGMCAWLAARTVVELAGWKGEDREGCGHLLLHFLTQHGPSCDVAVMQLLSSAAVTMYANTSRGMQDLLLLLQKLYSSTQAEHQRAGLILSRHVLKAEYAEPSDRDMVLRGIVRMNFSPSWPHAEHLYQAVLHAVTSLPTETLEMLLEHHIRPAAFQGGVDAGLLKIDEEDSSEYVVNILKYIRSKPISKPKAAAGSSELLRCMVHLEGARGNNLAQYCEKACNWFVEMPEDLQVTMPEDLKVSDKLDLDALSWTMRMADCCWLNWLVGIAFTDTFASGSTSKAVLPLVVRNRLSQAMKYAATFFTVLQPALQRFVKSASKDTFLSVGGLALHELLALTPRKVTASLSLLTKALALSGSVPAENSAGPRTRYLPPLQQMLELVENELDAAFGSEQAQAERDSLGHLNEGKSSGALPRDRVISCTSDLIESGFLAWLGFQAKVCIDEACKERSSAAQIGAEDSAVDEQIGDGLWRKTPSWKQWLKFGKGIYSILLRVVGKLNGSCGCGGHIWREVATSILKGIRRKGQKKADKEISVEVEIFVELESYGKKIADGGLAALYVALMRALLWQSEKRTEVGKLAGQLSSMIFPCDDVVPVAALPMPRMELGDPRQVQLPGKKNANNQGRFLTFLVETAIEYAPLERFSFASRVVHSLVRDDTGASAGSDSSSISGDFGMATIETAVNFLEPCFHLAQSSLKGQAASLQSLDGCKVYVEEILKGVKLSVLIMRGALHRPGSRSLLCVPASQKPIARFGSKIARILRKVVPNVAKACAVVCQDNKDMDMTEDVHVLLRESIDLAEALRALSTRLGSSDGKLDKDAGTSRLDADLLLASLQTCASTPLSALKPKAKDGIDTDSGDSVDEDDGGASRFYVQRSKASKRKRDQRTGVEDDMTSSDSAEEGDTETDVDEPVVINFTKKTSM